MCYNASMDNRLGIALGGLLFGGAQWGGMTSAEDGAGGGPGRRML